MAEIGTGAHDPAVVRRARIAVSLAFFAFGAGFAVWAVHIPLVAARLELDPAVLGLALLNMGLGGIVSQPVTGWFLQRAPSAPLARITLLVFIAAAVGPIVSPRL